MSFGLYGHFPRLTTLHNVLYHHVVYTDPYTARALGLFKAVDRGQAKFHRDSARTQNSNLKRIPLLQELLREPGIAIGGSRHRQ